MPPAGNACTGNGSGKTSAFAKPRPVRTISNGMAADGPAPNATLSHILYTTGFRNKLPQSMYA
jgi:hypothetical protein